MDIKNVKRTKKQDKISELSNEKDDTSPIEDSVNTFGWVGDFEKVSKSLMEEYARRCVDEQQLVLLEASERLKKEQ